MSGSLMTISVMNGGTTYVRRFQKYEMDFSRKRVEYSNFDTMNLGDGK